MPLLLPVQGTCHCHSPRCCLALCSGLPQDNCKSGAEQPWPRQLLQRAPPSPRPPSPSPRPPPSPACLWTMPTPAPCRCVAVRRGRACMSCCLKDRCLLSGHTWPCLLPHHPQEIFERVVKAKEDAHVEKVGAVGCSHPAGSQGDRLGWQPPSGSGHLRHCSQLQPACAPSLPPAAGSHHGHPLPHAQPGAAEGSSLPLHSFLPCPAPI